MRGFSTGKVLDFFEDDLPRQGRRFFSFSVLVKNVWFFALWVAALASFVWWEGLSSFF